MSVRRTLEAGHNSCMPLYPNKCTANLQVWKYKVKVGPRGGRLSMIRRVNVRFRFSLLTLLLALTVVGILLGTMANKAHRQRHAVARVQRLRIGAEVTVGENGCL